MKKVLDHGYVKLIESWGHGEDGHHLVIGPDQRSAAAYEDNEVGVIEAARMSTGKGFEGWEPVHAKTCDLMRPVTTSEVIRVEPQCSCKAKGDKSLLSFLFRNAHHTPFEMAGMTIEVQAPIFVFREWHRHRTQSYNELSARYTPLPDMNYIPTVERLMANATGSNKQANRADGAQELTRGDAERFREDLATFYNQAEEAYQDYLQAGVPKELARCFIPVARYSRMRASANLRNWLGFLTLRLAPNAQYEIREFAQAVSEIIELQFPRTWDLFINRKKE